MNMLKSLICDCIWIYIPHTSVAEMLMHKYGKLKSSSSGLSFNFFLTGIDVGQSMQLYLWYSLFHAQWDRYYQRNH